MQHVDGIMGLGATGLQLFQDAYYWRLPRLLRAPFALVVQTAIRVCDRFESAEAKRLNALVFAVVAEKA